MTRIRRSQNIGSAMQMTAGAMLLAFVAHVQAQGFRVPEELALPEPGPAPSVTEASQSPAPAAAEFKDEQYRGTFTTALAAFQEGRHAQALSMVRPVAERGQHDAEYLMGQFLESLPAPTQAQYREAAIWYLRGAHAGMPQAMNNLAALHVDGRGVPVTYSIARHWYQKAADAGYAVSQYNLALMHGRGQGMPRNDVLMLQWLQRAASAGLGRAQSQLGRLLLEGRPTDTQAVQAAEWIRKAAQQSDPYGQYLFGLILLRGTGIAPDPAAARDWLKRAADQGLPAASWELGRAYESGAGPSTNPELAFSHYEMAARANHVEALRRIIAIHRNGELGRPKDPAKADFWSLRLRLATRGSSTTTAGIAAPTPVK